MDSEATKVVFSRIQALDPDNASKIMGFIFIQDPPEKEMLRLASAPETILLSFINRAKVHLGISSNASSASGFSLQVPDQFDSSPGDLVRSPSGRSDSMIFPMSTVRTPLGISLNASPAPSPRVAAPNNNGFRPSGFSVQVPDQLDSPSMDPIMSPSRRSDSMFFPSNCAKTHLGISSNTSSAPSPRVIIPNNNDFHINPSSPSFPWPSGFSLQVPDQLDSPSMDPIISPSGRSDSMIFPSNSANNLHKRSFSVNDACTGGEEGSGFGWRPCMYYARGFCKNGGNCKFLHGGGHFGDNEGGVVAGSPSKIDGLDEMLRMKAIQQQQRLSQLMGGGCSFPYNKGMSFLNDSPRSAAAALMMGEEFHKFGRCRSESDFSAMGFGVPDSTARQIYLTFPADSTFKEEDVSNYFSTFGPVQDVRIPYQQKRMFGFVTFVYPETVKMILAKGNPHFVCDSRVLVKPYKEKGKIPEKRHHLLQFERGDFAGCSSPTGIDSREPYDLPVGPRMLLNNQEMMRRKLEHAEFQQALELQGRRLMNLQLMQLKNQHHHHHHANQFHPPGNPISSLVQSHHQMDDSFLLQSENFNHDISEDNGNSFTVPDSMIAAADEHQDELHGGKDVCDNNNTDSNVNDDIFNGKNDNLLDSLEHNLPDNLFASPTKSAAENGSMFSSALSESDSSAPLPRPWHEDY